MIKFIYIFFCFLALNIYAEEDFSATVTLSNEEIPLDQTLEVTLSLKFPSDFSTDQNILRQNLMQQRGLKESRFILVDEKILKDLSGEISIRYTLEPLFTGEDTVSFWAIPFNSKDGTSHEVVSEILRVKVVKAKIDPAFIPKVSPLLSISEAYRPTINQKEIEKTKTAKVIAALFKQKTLPWHHFFALLVLFTVFILIEISSKKD